MIEATVTRLGVRTVFVAGPFFKLVDPVTGVMSARDRARFERLIHYFEGSGCIVNNAHRRESWGEAFLGPTEFTKLDYSEIDASDLIIAVPGPPASLGTHIELGWASAMGKPIVLLLEKDEDYALMVYGLRHVTKTAVVETADGDFELSALEDAVIAVCGA